MIVDLDGKIKKKRKTGLIKFNKTSLYFYKFSIFLLSDITTWPFLFSSGVMTRLYPYLDTIYFTPVTFYQYIHESLYIQCYFPHEF